MNAGGAFRRAVRRRRRTPDAGELPVFWGRVGAYEGVTRRGVLLLLAPAPGHPSRRVTNGP